jgi:hypothetical protein
MAEPRVERGHSGVLSLKKQSDQKPARTLRFPAFLVLVPASMRHEEI